MGHDWTMGPPAAQWCERTANPGWASKLTWATTRRPTTQSAGDSFEKTDDSGTSHDLHRRTGDHQADGLGGAWPDKKYALRVRKHIAVLRKARPDIIIEIRWCPAHKRVPGNEKANEWAKLVAEEPDTCGSNG